MMRARFVVEKVTTLSPKHAPTVARPSMQLRFSERRVRKSVMQILETNILCSIATVTRTRRAHISHLYFAYSENLEFFFLSDPSSLHSRLLLKNASMAMSVYSSAQPWDRPGRGLAFWGRCAEARGRQAATAEEFYAKRFRAYARNKSELAAETDGAFRYRFYRFVPRRVKILDEGEFGGGMFVVVSVRRQ